MLFPRDVLAPRRVDEHFADEAAAARDQGLDVVLMDHDALVAGDVDDALRRTAAAVHPLLYRGWMITPDAWVALEAALASRDASLLISADEFARAHHLPGWYSLAAPHTPESVWTVGDDVDEFVHALAGLGSGAAVIKDYSKSEKGYWDEAMFIPDVTDAAPARSVVERFRELREDAFDGGFVGRRFEPFESAECRTWWVRGECVLITPHPDSPDDEVSIAVDDLPRLAEPPSAFFTMDVVRQAETGAVRIIELGDGQVSDRPSTTPAADFIGAIVSAIS